MIFGVLNIYSICLFLDKTMVGGKRKLGSDTSRASGNAQVKDNFFQPHMKSQVTQKLVNQHDGEKMKEIEHETLNKLKTGVADYYKSLQKNDVYSTKILAPDKPIRKELLKPSSKITLFQAFYFGLHWSCFCKIHLYSNLAFSCLLWFQFLE